MRGKLLFVAGIAAGYVIGARAGRSAYEAITLRVQEFRENPTVLKVGGKAKNAVSDAAPGVAETVSKVAETATAAASAAGAAGAGAGAAGSDPTTATSADSDGAASSSSEPTPSPEPGPTPTAPPSSKTDGPANSSGAASGAEESSAPGSAG